VFLLWIIGGLVLSMVVAFRFVHTGSSSEMVTALLVFFAGGMLTLWSADKLDHWLPRQRRQKPPGYIGKFRRPDGSLVHVARLPDHQVMVVSEAEPGMQPRDLGTVTGPELAHWEKVGVTPD
jgi:hypothetical protein